MLDLGEQMARHQDGAAACGPRPQQVANGADALGVEAVGRFVEDQHWRVTQQRCSEAEPLAHAERIGARTAVGGGTEADEF